MFQILINKFKLSQVLDLMCQINLMIVFFRIKTLINELLLIFILIYNFSFTAVSLVYHEIKWFF